MLTVCCVRQGERYGPEYVRRLYAAVRRNITAGTEGRFVCFTDQPDELPDAIEMRALPEGVVGWWNKLYLFKAGLFDDGDRILYFDLDTVIVGDLDAIAAYDGEFAILRDFYSPLCVQSSVMAWRAGFGTDIWAKWEAAGYPDIMGGDQAWIDQCYPICTTWQSILPGLFVSFKEHCRPLPPESASVVVFHGDPKPHDCGVPWVEAMWSEGDAGHFTLPMVANVGLAQIRAQSKSSAARDVPHLRSEPANQLEVLLIGGGPSLGDPISIVEIRRHRAARARVWALNGTYDWLVEHAIVPDALVILDAREDNRRFVEGVGPPTLIYLASQCHPALYDAIPAFRTVRYDIETLGDCGTTVGMHAIAVAHVEGYRRIHLYGFDSSYRGNDGHAYRQDLNRGEHTVDAHIGDKVFRAAPWMARQAQDFEGIAAAIAEAGGELVVHGDGLLPEVARVLAEASASDTRIVNGYMWPRGDSDCAAVVFNGVEDLAHAYAHMTEFGVAVQAGGNCGVWPKAMARKFKTVYTFEADPLNFRCLAHNVPEANCFKFNAALGYERRGVEMGRAEHNAGAHHIDGIGAIPTLRIDDLNLVACDLIYLDIEGYEIEALKGAAETIERCRPVIAIEDKGLSLRYGHPQGFAEELLATQHGYRVAERVRRDVIFIPPPRKEKESAPWRLILN